MHRLRTTLMGLGLAGLCGCGDRLVDVKATLRLDGQPLDGASVTLVSSGSEATRDAHGSTNASGVVAAFTTFTRDDGVMPGQYRVIVNKSPGGAPAEIPRMNVNDPEALKRFQEATKGGNTAYTRTELPRIYLDSSRTPLQCDVTPNTDEVVLELVSTAGD